MMKEFLAELTELSKKHKIYINGCGCCGSPQLLTGENIKAFETGKYYKMKDTGYPELNWIADGSDYEWLKEDIEIEP